MKRSLAMLGVITLASAALRFWRLDAIPPGFHYDEAYEALEAWRILNQSGYQPLFFAGNFGVEPFFIYLTAAAFRAFGETPVVMRGVAASVGTLTIPLLYAMAREVTRAAHDMRSHAPLWAAATLGTLRWHVTYSRIGIEPILVPLLLCGLLWGFLYGLRTGRRRGWLVMGLCAGLGPYAYPAGRLLPVLALLLGLLGLFYARRQPAEHRRTLISRLALAGLLAALIFAPLAAHWARHPEQLLLRSSQLAVSTNAPGHNLLATLGMFSVRGDMDVRNNIPGMPVLDVLLTIPFTVGLVLSLRKLRQPAHAALWIAFGLLLLPTILSEYAPHFRRALGAAPIVAMWCGLGLAALTRAPRGQDHPYVPALPPRLSRAVTPAALARGWQVGRWIIVGALFLGSSVYGLTAYFNVWGRDPALFYAYDQGLWEIGQYVLTLPPEQTVYISPRPQTDMTLAFALRQRNNVRHFDGRNAFIAHPEAGPATYIIIKHEDFRGAAVLHQLYGSASEAHVFHDRDGQVYARAYQVPDHARLDRTPQTNIAAHWPAIHLSGYDLNQGVYRPGESVYLQLWWQAAETETVDWTVFVHVIGPAKPDGSVLWAGDDAQPGEGSAPTSSWHAGDVILDEHEVRLPPDLPPGHYKIEIGLYDPKRDGVRAVLTQSGDDHLSLGPLIVQ